MSFQTFQRTTTNPKFAAVCFVCGWNHTAHRHLQHLHYIIKTTAERPEEDRRESARKAADTSFHNMVRPGIPGQPQSYDAELRGATVAVEREVCF